MRDLHKLPKLRDSLTYLYAEHCIVEQSAKAIELFDKDGSTLVPAAALTVLLLGPGTRITHAAMKTLADNGCTVVWVGEDATRYYAHGQGETRRAYHLLHQACLASDDRLRLEVCKRMYRMRFGERELDPELSIQQLRGMEGARMRTAYAQASMAYGVPWHGRSYDRSNWGNSDPVNRALSAANALLNGICHAAIVSGGYSPALGFIHTGKQRSFVYDIADLYKTEITIPLAFRITSEGTQRLGPRVREACREAFREAKLLHRILPDIDNLLDVPSEILEAGSAADADPARPEPLWEPSATAAIADPSSETPSTAASLDASPASSDERPPATEKPIEVARAPLPTAEAEPQSTAPTQRSEADEKALRLRRDRALAGLESGWRIEHSAPETWTVITRPGSSGYTIRRDEGTLICNCPDYEKKGLGACKHTFAVEEILARRESS